MIFENRLFQEDKSPKWEPTHRQGKITALKLPYLQSPCTLEMGRRHLHFQREETGPGHRVPWAFCCHTRELGSGMALPQGRSFTVFGSDGTEMLERWQVID